MQGEAQPITHNSEQLHDSLIVLRHSFGRLGYFLESRELLLHKVARQGKRGNGRVIRFYIAQHLPKRFP